MDETGEIVITINQLANRLENSTVSERIDALQELQRLARSNPDAVGSFSLKKVLDFLQEQSSAEEYQEALDLIYKLVKSRNKTAAKLNTDCILSETSAVELLLDLLEHQDATVGVMSSQILSVIHANNGKLLESQIQMCPDGMNKLLQRLPDNSREEVRNEAIVLIQQLTSQNEEMKKTVVFNDGFEILFRIIQSEGGHKECGVVISSCLHICSNILSDSETCQRLFFAMGGDWILQLANFFDPMLLENLVATKLLIDEEKEQQEERDLTAAGPYAAVSACWFDNSNRLLCAVLAMNALFNSLSTPNAQHCLQAATATSVVLPAAGYWISRRGPAELVNASLALLKRLLDCSSGDSKAIIGNKISELILKVAAAQSRKNFPADVELPSLSFGWRPIATDERRFVALLSLLAERYIFPAAAWLTSEGRLLPEGSTHWGVDVMATDASAVTVGATTTAAAAAANEGEHKNRKIGSAEVFASSCLAVFESVLLADSNISDFMVQYVLAPPPPPAVDGSLHDDAIVPSSTQQRQQQRMETMRPLGALVLQLLIDGCHKVIGSSSGGFSAKIVPVKGSSFDSIVVAERAANIVTVIFLAGSQLGKELATAVTTLHIRTAAGNNNNNSSNGSNSSNVLDAEAVPKSLLVLLLSAAGRAARLPQGAGYPLLVSILRALAAIASGSEVAARQMLEDPSNLFVVDIATAGSEAAGVPAVVQIAACLFLGCCFDSMPALPTTTTAVAAATTSVAAEETVDAADGSQLNRKSFLTMIDSRIGLNRFTDILKRPLVGKRQIHSSGSNSAAQSYASSLFISDGFKSFYEKQVEAIRTGLFDFYTGSLNSAVGEGRDSGLNMAQQQVIEMQKDRIAELEARLIQSSSESAAASTEAAAAAATTALPSPNGSTGSLGSPSKTAAAVAEARQQIHELQVALTEKEHKLHDTEEANKSLQSEIGAINALNELLQSSQDNGDKERELSEKLQSMQSQLQKALESVQSLESANSSLTQQFRDAVSRAELVEQQNYQLQLDVVSTKSTLAARDEDILKLKQSVLDESAGSKLLRETLDHRERKIELLLEELKCGSPSKGDALAAAERKVTDLENRNSELTQQLWAKEAELEAAAVAVAPTTNAATDAAAESAVTATAEAMASLVSEAKQAEAGVNVLVEAVLSLVSNLDINIDDIDGLKSSLEDNSKPIYDRCQLLDYALNECCQKINSAVGECSDIAEGAGLFNLDGSEGSVERFVSCCRQLREQLQDVTAQVASVPEYQQQIADLELLYAESEKTKQDFFERVAELEKQPATIVSATTDNGAAINDNDGASTLILQQQAAIESLQQNLDSANERIKSLQEELNAQSVAINSLEDKKVHLISEVAAVKQRLKEEQLRSEEELNNVNLACDVLQERLDTADEQIHSLRSELAVARSATTAGDDLEDALSQLQAQTRELQNSQLAHNALAEQLVEANSKVTQLQEEAVQKQEQHEQDMDVLRSALEDAEEKRDSLEVATHHLQHTLEQVKRERVEQVTALRTELTEVRALQEQAEAKRDSLEVQVRHLQHQLDLSVRTGDQSSSQLHSELENIIAAKLDAEMATEALKQQVTALEKQIIESNDCTEQQLLIIQSDIAEQKKQNAVLVAQLSAAKEAAKVEVATLQNAVDAAAVVLKEMNLKLLRLEEELEEEVQKSILLQKELTAAATSTNQEQLEKERAEHQQSLLKVKAAALEEANAITLKLTAAIKEAASAAAEVKVLESALKTERSYLNESESKLQQLRASSQQEIQTLQSKNRQMLSSMEELAAKITSQEAYVSDLYAQQAKRAATERATERELQDLRKAVKEYEEVTGKLEAEKSQAEQLLRIANNGDSNDIDAFRAQEQELQRLTRSFDQLSRELCSKDQQLQHVTNLLQRREGEAAGVMATMDGIKTDLDLLREENCQLNDSLASSQRHFKDVERELKALKASLQLEKSQSEGLRSQLQSEKHRHRSEDAQAVHHSDVIRSVEAQLKDVISWLVKSHHISDYAVTSGKGEHGSYAVSISSSKDGKPIVDITALIETVRNCVFWIQRMRDAELRGKSSLLHEKERELTATRRSLQELTDQLAAARRDVDLAKAAAATAVATASANTAANHRLGRDRISGSSNSSSSSNGGALNGKEYGHGRSSSAPATPNRNASDWLSNSSAAKEAARLNSEMMKERRKLQNLQQQHSDLLSLLAQQEVELSVFRSALQQRLTTAQFERLQNDAQQQSIELYGSYTNFR